MDNDLTEIKEILKSLGLAQIKTDAQLAQTDAQLAKTDAQLAKTDAQVKATSKMVSGIGINLGKSNEHFFYTALKEKMAIGDIKFDSISENVSAKKGKLQAQFDMIMYNGMQWLS